MRTIRYLKDGKLFARNIETVRLQAAEKQEHHQDDHDEAQAAAWVVAPATTVGPSGQTAKREQYENDQQD
jgi:hypothetical protein